MGRRPGSDASDPLVIVVDSSVWVELLRGTGSPSHLLLRELIESDADLATTEVIITELMAGARDPDVQALRARLLAFPVLRLQGLQDFERAALLYRRCRRSGNEIRSLTDCLIAVPIIRAGATLLHEDADFEVIAENSELQTQRA